MGNYIGFSFEAEPLSSSHFLVFALGFVWASNTGGNTIFRIAFCNLQLRVSINLRGQRNKS